MINHILTQSHLQKSESTSDAPNPVSLHEIKVELEPTISLKDTPNATQIRHEASESGNAYFNENQISLSAEILFDLNKRMRNGKRLLAILSAAEKEKWSATIMNDCQDYLEQLINSSVTSETCLKACVSNALSNFSRFQ